jgi:hypothetical protein
MVLWVRATFDVVVLLHSAPPHILDTPGGPMASKKAAKKTPRKLKLSREAVRDLSPTRDVKGGQIKRSQQVVTCTCACP